MNSRNGHRHNVAQCMTVVSGPYFPGGHRPADIHGRTAVGESCSATNHDPTGTHYSRVGGGFLFLCGQKGHGTLELLAAMEYALASQWPFDAQRRHGREGHKLPDSDCCIGTHVADAVGAQTPPPTMLGAMPTHRPSAAVSFSPSSQVHPAT
jgi:hypothetical protein